MTAVISALFGVVDIQLLETMLQFSYGIASAIFIKGVPADPGSFTEVGNTPVVFLLLRDILYDPAHFCPRQRLSGFLLFAFVKPA